MHSDLPSANVENERRKSCMEKNTPDDSPILGISFFASATSNTTVLPLDAPWSRRRRVNMA
jgi:hypothetical protein